MLEPQNRRLLLEALRPPDGFKLDAAIGTTYTLDLVALLTAPLSFAFFDWQDDDGRPLADPLALVEAVRRHADRIALFCQAGEIKVPTGDRRLLSYLEESVVQVAPKAKNHVFHPKVWVLRYAAELEPVRYRLVCLSRNLTFDRSWDTAVVLDGELANRQRAIATNNPLGDFVQALPSLALEPVPPRVMAEVDRMQQDVRRVRFEVPQPFTEVAFWPGGIPGAQSPFDYELSRLLVVSPFLSDTALERMTDTGKKHVLISRPDSLAALKPETLAAFDRVCTLGDAVDGEPSTAEESEEVDDTELRGLHAKVYVVEQRWDASVFTGSANATNAAFGGNVEFLVELKGKKSRCGIDAMLATEGGQATLASLLHDVSGPIESPPGDPVREHLEALLAKARSALVQARPRLAIRPSADETFGMTLEFPNTLKLSPELTLAVWPITLHPELGKEVAHAAERAELGPVSLEALTTFMAFELLARDDGGKESRSRFVLNVPADGMPAGRREKMLRWLLQDRNQVLRLLLLLLADDPEEAIESLLGGTPGGEQSGSRRGIGGRQVFESLLRCLDRGADRLDEVANLVTEMSADPETAKLLPEDFQKVWAPIWAARERMKGGGGAQST